MAWRSAISGSLALHLILLAAFIFMPKPRVEPVKFSTNLTNFSFAPAKATPKQHPTGTSLSKLPEALKTPEVQAPAVISLDDLPEAEFKPHYPRRALELKQEGTLTLRIKFENGVKKEVLLQSTSGFKLLDEAALKAAEEWQAPSVAMQNFWVEIPVRFKIK